MSDRSDPPQKPSRIIVPGDSSAEPAPARIILPGGGPLPEPEDDEATEREAAPARGAKKPHGGIILPPGVGQETPEDVPEFPRLRPVVLMPVSDGQRELLLVSDPLGVIPGQPVLSMETLPLLQLFDGTLSLQDITAAVMRESKDIRVAGMIKEFVAQLDELLLLESPRFHKALQALRDAYHPLEIRPAALEGRSYPADPAELTKTLNADFEAAEKLRSEAGQPVASPDARPRAIMSPHLDPRRAGPTIARAFLELGPEQQEPLRIVIFGTGHSLYGELFALTRKHFETPIGRVMCDTAFVDLVAGKLGELAYQGELAHREEHSIEFQAVYLAHRLAGRKFTIVPILCGGFHALIEDGIKPREDPTVEGLIRAVMEAEAASSGPTIYVAGVDFSHIGTRFGDPPIDARVKEETEKHDRAAIEPALQGDADAWFESIATHNDSTRICGFAPTYVMLRCAGVKDGRLLHYEQSDEEGSTVSIASIAWG